MERVLPHAADTIHNSVFDTWLPLGRICFSKIVYLQKKKPPKITEITFSSKKALKHSDKKNARKKILPSGNVYVSLNYCLVHILEFITIQIHFKYYTKSRLCISLSKYTKRQALLWWESIPREAPAATCTSRSKLSPTTEGGKTQVLLLPC